MLLPRYSVFARRLNLCEEPQAIEPSVETLTGEEVVEEDSVLVDEDAMVLKVVSNE